MKRRFFSFSHLSTRIFLVIVVVLLIPSICMMYFVKIHMENLLHEEISEKVAKNLQHSQTEIDQLFSRMANISTVFFLSPEFTQAFSDEPTPYYDRYVAFRNVLSDISIQNLYHYASDNSDSAIDQFKITFFDSEDRIYASWSQNFNDYSYLARQDWMHDNSVVPGFMIWNMQAVGYMPEGIAVENDQIALARSMRSDYLSDRSTGTLLISIDREQIAQILSAYKYDTNDIVFASVPGDDVLFSKGMDASFASEVVKRYSRSSQGSDVIDVNGGKYLLSYYTVNRINIGASDKLKIYYLTDYHKLGRDIGKLVTKINISCVLFIGLVLLIAGWISIYMSRPIQKLAIQMRQYQAGDLPVVADSRRSDEIGAITTAYHSMAISIHNLLDRLKKEQATKEKYHYESLKSKMSPHFLFNTLTSIRWMAIIRKADNIRDSIDSLASILRYSLSDDVEMVPLSCELDVIKSYCDIHNLRTGNRDRLVIEMDEALLDLRIIKFILQPAVENCFKHAFKGELNGGMILISGAIEDDHLIIRICDNGPGFSEEILAAYQTRTLHRDGGGIADAASGIGLNTIDERIRLSCGADCGIQPGRSALGGAMLTYRLTIIKDEALGGVEP